MNDFLVECCANSIKSALEGEKGGAHRIELCSNLEFGGVTPSREEISGTKEAINIPIRILIRPRVGDFIYNEKEYQQIISDINFCKKQGLEGVVVGSLNVNGSINIDQTKGMVNQAKPMHVTFHRAFDEANNLEDNLNDIIRCGCHAILTSGQRKNVNDGIINLNKLISLSNNRIQILAGGGVNYKNAKKLYKIGIRNFHLSGTEKNEKKILETKSINIKKLIKTLSSFV